MGRGAVTGLFELEAIDRVGLGGGSDYLLEEDRKLLDRVESLLEAERFDEAIVRFDEIMLAGADPNFAERFVLMCCRARFVVPPALFAEQLSACFCGSRKVESINKKLYAEAWEQALSAVSARFDSRPNTEVAEWVAATVDQAFAAIAGAYAAKRLLSLDPLKRYERLFKGTRIDAGHELLIKYGPPQNLLWPDQERMSEITRRSALDVRNSVGTRTIRAHLRARVSAEAWPLAVEEITSNENGAAGWNAPGTISALFSVWKQEYPQLVLTMEEWCARAQVAAKEKRIAAARAKRSITQSRKAKEAEKNQSAPARQD